MSAPLRGFAGVILFMGLVALLGCGGSAPRSEAPAIHNIDFAGGGGDDGSLSNRPVDASTAEGISFHSDYSRVPAEHRMVSRQPPTDEPAGKAPAGAPRKIIYTADLQIYVKDMTPAQEAVEQYVKDHKGFVAQRDITGSVGSPRRGQWRIRIPTDQFDAFLKQLAEIGEVQRNKIDSKDVSEEFYDLEIRIRNKKSEEVELLKLQKEATDRLQKEPTAKMADVLAVREKVDQARTEIERMQGRLQYLANLSEYTTVNLTLTELRANIDPRPVAFGTTLGRTFTSSLEMLVSFGQGIVLVIVALVPWLPVIAVIVIPCWLLLRRLRRPRQVEPVPVLPVQP
jgi:hypothetical protein